MAAKKDTASATAVLEPPTTAEIAVISESPSNEVVQGVSDEDIRACGIGAADFGKDDIALSFLKAIQDSSPQVKEREPKYIPGSKPGMFFDTVIGRIWPGTPGIIVIPVKYTPSYVEWKPDRGGFVADHGNNPAVMSGVKKGGKDGKEDVLPNGNIITRNALYYIFIFDENTGEVVEIAFSLSGTGMTVSRRWNSVIKGIRHTDARGTFNPACFYMAYRLETFLDTDHSEDFFSYKVTPYKKTTELGPLGPALFKAAAKFRELIDKGAVQVKQEQEPDQRSGGNGAADDVPF